MMLRFTVYTGLVKEACEGPGQGLSRVYMDDQTEAEGSGTLTKFSRLLSRVGASGLLIPSALCSFSQTFRGESEQMCKHPSAHGWLQASSEPVALGWRFQGRLGRKMAWGWGGVGLWRHLQGPSATKGEGLVLRCFPHYKEWGCRTP